MNILFANLRSDIQGHKFFDSLYVDAMSKNHRVFLVSPQNWYDHDFNGNVRTLRYEPKKNPYLDLFGRMRFIKRATKKNAVDLIVLSTFFVKRMAPILKYLQRKGTAIALVHHNTVDLLNEDAKAGSAFERYKNGVFHFVFEPYIRDHLVDERGVSADRVFVIPHPLADRRADAGEEKNFDCVSLGNLSDEGLLDEFVSLEKSEGVFLKNRLRVFFKSKTVEFDDGALTVRKGYLSNEEFSALMRGAKRALILYPASYRYRVSGVAMEAVGYGTSIVGNGIELFRRYADDYPGLINLINDEKEIPSLLTRDDESPKREESVDRFIRDHKVETVSGIMERVFNVIRERSAPSL